MTTPDPNLKGQRKGEDDVGYLYPSNAAPISPPESEERQQYCRALHFQGNNVLPPAVERDFVGIRPGIAGRRTHSHVSFGYFNHQGVLQLERQLSQDVSSAGRPVPEEGSPTESGQSLEGGGHEERRGHPELGEEPFDFGNTLKYVMRRREEMDIKGRHLGAVFEDLRVIGLGASASFQPTLGSLLNPFGLISTIRNIRHPPLRDIISGFNGVVRQGEMLLVLGRPGSGCSTFLKILANQRQGFHAVEGDVHYDSLSPKDIAQHYRGDVQYCPEDDVHFPTLTVDQTIRFAAATRAPQRRIDQRSRQDFTRMVTDICETIFGLKHVKDTFVGDASIRGVSGGEKKRVSISENLATRSLMTSWDNSTRGLDSSTALEYVRALRIGTDLIKNSTIVSIYQAGESLFEIFDKVCLIYEGKMVYYGPASKARQYFIDMGYIPAARQTTPDFLVSVTDPLGRTVAKTENDTRLRQPIPQTSSEFEEYYKHSDLYKRNSEEIERYKQDRVKKDGLIQAFKASAKQDHAQHTRRKSPFMISVPMQIRIVMIRRMQIMKGNFTSQALSTISFILQAVIIGTTFLKIPEDTSAYFSRGGVLFFAVFVPALFSMSEIPALFAQRPIILRHRNAAMYHPFVEALAMTLVDIPFTLVTIIFFTVIIYFVVRLQQTASQFFTFFVVIVVVALAMKAFFRGLASAFSAEAPAQAVAGVLILALSLYTGYQIPRPSMIGALRWISYINPIFYAFEALMVNEFHTLDGSCSTLVPSGPGYESISLSNQVCTVVGSEPGQFIVSGARYLELSFNYRYTHLWRNFGILTAFMGLFLFCYLTFTEINTGLGGKGSILLFKKGSKSEIIKEVKMSVKDTEKAESDPSSSTKDDRFPEKEEEALKNQPKMVNTFSWQHINYHVPVAGENRLLLNDVSGFVAPGKLTALMGESGAGKTTLLNVLAERVEAGIVTGDRFFNGQGLPVDFQAQTGYCQQMDTHVPTTTVREALRFSARLRQPSSVPLKEKDEYVEKCLEMCGLESFADAIVGTLGVEQKKRTTIGVELAAKPQLLLFLDEPTSGLDSQSAWAIMAFLRNLADNGQTILCTIHQPSAELFSIFDRLLLLMKGGKTVYFGDVGKNAQEIINYFEGRGARPCKPGENPAEYMLDVIGAGATATTDRDWHEVWLQSEGRNKLDNDLHRIHEEGRKHPPVGATVKSQFAAPWTFQTWELIKRQNLAFWRNPTYLMSKLSLNIIGGLFIGFTFFKSKNSIQDTQNKLFAIFMGTILSAPLGNQIHVPYINMRNVYEIRERSSRMYHWSAFCTSQIALEIPWNIIGSTLFFFCWYWTVGFEKDRGAFTYLMYGFSFPIYYTSIALAVASLCPSAEIAGLMYSFIFTFIFTFEGVLQPFHQLGWWRWMYYVTPFTYLIEAIVGQALGNQEIRCSERELLTLQPPSAQACGTYMSQYITHRGGYLTNPDASSDCLFCPYKTTDEWMGPLFNIFYSHHWRDFGIFWAYIVFNIFLVYLLTYLARVRTYTLIPNVIQKVRKGMGKDSKKLDES